MSLDTQLSFRLSSELARKLEEIAAARGVDRSEVVRDALRLYLEGLGENDRPWERIADLAGAASGGPSDLGSSARKHLREILGAD